ncbi:MAG: hypothetical protein IPN93_17930 [Bacteroidetes bacterium]|nr:hypothetical protein [Bacteroidota bacterium]
MLQEYKIQKTNRRWWHFFHLQSYIDTSELVFSAYHTTESFLNEVENLTFDRELVLLKGARSLFRKISSYLQG